MNFESGRHCNMMRSIGVPLGLWPYRRTVLRKMNGAIAVIVTLLCIVVQLAVFVTHEFSVDLFLKCATGIVPPTFYILKYFYFIWNMDQAYRDTLINLHRNVQVKYIFEWIQSDYDSLANERELRLTEKCADLGRSISKVWLYSLLLAFIPIGLPYLSVLLNMETLVNQTRTVLLPINAEYFLDQDRYFYWIALHFDTTTLLGISILFVTESTTIYFVTHACGLLEITGDRVQRMWESSILNVRSTKTHSSLRDQLVATIQLHQRALQFIEYLNTSFLIHYFILITVGVVSLSMNLYIVARGILLMEVTAEMLTALILVIVHFSYMGCGNYIGQLLLDKGDQLFTKTYYVRWHESPPPVQKMMLYIRQRSMQPTGLVFGGLYTASLQFLSKLVNTSMSYFTMIYSTT